MAIKGTRYDMADGYPKGVFVPNPEGMQPSYTRGQTRQITKRSGFYACMSGELEGTNPGDRKGAIENFKDAVATCL